MPPPAGFNILRRHSHSPLVALYILLLELCGHGPWCATALGDFRGSGIRAGAAAFHSSATAAVATADGGGAAQVYYVSEVAERLASVSAARQGTAERFHDAEQARLQAAIQGAGSQHDKSLLEDAAVVNEEARLASQNAFGEMLNLITTLKQSMGTSENVESCQFLSCGEHGYCDEFKDHARCRCQEGYEGNGFVCKPPARTIGRPLFRPAPGTPSPRIADLHVSTLRGNRVALAFRDLTAGHRGFLVIGQADLTGMRWGTPIPFSNHSQAFGPVLAELQDGGGVAVAFRDADRGGSGILVGGRYEHDQHRVQFGPPRAFARHQAQSMGIVALPQSLVAVIFAEHTANRATGVLEAGAMYGSAVLAKVGASAPPEVLGKRRFASGPVARLSAVLLSPTSFLVAFRQAEDTAGGERAEASCAVAQLHGGELVFDPRALSLEPEQDQIWARSVASLGDGLAAYTYHSGREQLTKQALLRIDPRTHQLSVLRGPVVIGEGFTPYVGSVSTATPLAQHTSPEQSRLLQGRGQRVVAYFSGAGGTRPRARLCGVDGVGSPDGCKEFAWADHEVSSVAGAQVGDGRFVLVSSDAVRVPYFQLLGVMDPR